MSDPQIALHRLGKRPATQDDRQLLFVLYSSTRKTELDSLPLTEPQKQLFLKMQFDAQTADYQSRYPDANFEIIELDSLTVGKFSVERTSNEIRLIEIIIDEDFRGCGIGTKLIRDLIQEAERERKSVVLNVLISNPVHRLYERMGFRVVQTDQVYDTMKWSLIAE